jgi:hypothetical protein
MKKVITLGKIDYYNTGRKNNLCELVIDLNETDKGYAFSMSGFIWNTKKTDCLTCGQICEDFLMYFPNNEKVKRLVEIWKEYHLNDLQAGTEKQMVALKNAPQIDYKAECLYLESIGLLIDNGYEYGSGWLFKTIPSDIIEEIKELIK